jgi:hypothetical protein
MQGLLENQNIGGGGFGGLGNGGFGAFGLVGLLGLDSLGNRRRGEGDGVTSLDADGIAAKTALLVNQNADQNALLNAIAGSKDTTVAEGRSLGAAICESEKTTLNQFYASAIQAANNTQSIKDQATGFAIVNDKRFDDVTTQIANTTAAILSRINDVENQNLRDQLFESRRRIDAKENELHVTNTNINTNAQLQAQAQLQTQRDFDNIRRFDNLFSQVAKSGQDIINVGGLMAGVAQTANPVNVKS